MKRIFLLSTILFTALTAARAQTVLNMLNAKNGMTYIDSWIYVDAQNNFRGASFAIADGDSIVPAAGWTDKVAAEPGTEIIAYLKGVYYRIYITEYIVHSSETVKTKESRFEYTTETRRGEETLGVRINYRYLTGVKTERTDSADARRKPAIFITYVYEQDGTMVVPKIKTALAKHDCSFTRNAPQSDLQLYLKATYRQFNSDGDFVYCYLDVTFELFDTSDAETVYFDSFSQKGVSTSRDRAVRAAIDDAAEAISEKIASYINNKKN
jgi:hypothetical protein